jgi:large subunit ribosomal protein L10
MNRDEKTAVVEELTGQLKDAEAIFAVDYRGISVPQAAELREGLREAGASFRVVKNRLTLRAADAAGAEDIKDFLKGPTALTLVDGDVALAAKTLSRLGGEWELLEFKGGIMDGAALDPDSFQAIAKLPGRDQLNAQFAGIVASPLTGLVRGLGSMVQGLASQLQQIADQGLVSGEAPEAPSGDSAAQPTASPEGTPGGEAEDVAPDGEAGAPETPEAPAEEPAAEEAPAADSDVEASPPDPEPEDSPEEAPSEEEAPEGESAGMDADDAGTGEGDQDLGEDAGEDAEQDEPPSEDTPSDDTPSDETSEDSDESKENE